MNAYLPFEAIELWHIAGWTMIHFLWLGALVAAAALVCRLLLRRASSNVRYATALLCLLLLATTPLGIAAWLIQNSPPLLGGARGGFVSAVEQVASAEGTDQGIIELADAGNALAAQAKIIEDKAAVVSSAGTKPSPNPSLTGSGIFLARLEACVPYFPWLWLIGTPITFALLAAL